MSEEVTGRKLRAGIRGFRSVFEHLWPDAGWDGLDGTLLIHPRLGLIVLLVLLCQF
ncbi:MAG: hypothetical protein ACLSDJ_02170 [Butyricimonas faecihominis]